MGKGLDDVLVFALLAFLSYLGIRANGEGAEREGALLCPLGEGLGKQVQAGDQEQDTLSRAGDFLGDLEGGESLAGAASHDELATVGGLESEQDIGAGGLLVAGPVGVDVVLGF